jgi:phage terminase small subunit
MRGRKPKPTALKILQGNPGHRKIDELSEPQPVIGLGVPPSFLTGDAEAGAYWYGQGPELVKLRTLGESDATTFAQMCIHHSRIVRLSGQINTLRQRKRPTGKSESLLDKYESQRAKTIAAFQKIADGFGMNAAARTRIKIKPDDGQAEFGFDRPAQTPLERAMGAARSA